jgi:CBS domain-containing protein
MENSTKVGSIMTADVYSVSDQATLKQVIAYLRKHKVRHLPVVAENRVVGMISRTDIDRLSFGGLFDNQEDADEALDEILTVPQVMTSKPRVVSPQASIKEVAEIFTQEDYHALPVVEEGQLKGIVTTTDVIKYMLSNY